MEKRLLLAMILSLFILLVYQSYVEKQNERWRAARQEALREHAGEMEFDSEWMDPAGTIATPDLTERFRQEEHEPRVAARDVDCEEVIVDTPLYNATFCSGLGRPMRWALKDYQPFKPSRCSLLGRGRDGGRIGADFAGKAWVERIRAQAPEEYPLGLEIATGRDTRFPIREALKPDRLRVDLRAGDGPVRLRFAGTDSVGRPVERVYTFSPDTYTVGLEIEIRGLEPALHQAGVAMKLTDRTPEEDKSRYTFAGFMAYINNRLEKEKGLKAGDPRYYSGHVSWAGFSDTYFLTCLIPEDSPVSSVNLEQTHPAQDPSESLFISRLIYNIQNHLEGDAARFAYSLYIGPKDLDVLNAAGHSLEKSIDLGWFGFIAKPLLVVLKFFYRYTHNYGIAIIILTILIKILFHPLTRKQYESMREMQKLQPKMQAIREKYKSDRERMNREVMDLYRTHKINPLGGCWPMLLQIPVFFALYKALLNSIELRHAPFMLWIQDLSEKDPCYITPIIMGATMFLQQKMTPAMGDPNQQKIMMFLPVIFTFMFLNFPSGLVLYWLVNNVLTIGQQFVSQRRKK